MFKYSIDELCTAIDGTLISNAYNGYIQNVTIDSRVVEDDSVFFALVGEVTDGHNYINSAIDNGVKAIIVHKEIDKLDGVAQILVADTFNALQKLAKHYIEKFDIPFVAITGSSGKTTTKDIVAQVLSQKYSVHKTIGNLNSTTGVPLTIFKLKDTHQISVIEMSMSHKGEIYGNAEIVHPNTAVITNIGQAHIEFLGSQKEIFLAKKEICGFLTENDNLIINVNDEYLSTISNEVYKIIKVGIDAGKLSAFNINNSKDGVSFDVEIEQRVCRFSFPIPGNHNILNALCAIQVGLIYGMTPEEIQLGLTTDGFSKNRMEKTVINGITLINDSYNANPTAMNAALDVLGYYNDCRKIAVLGDMFELGENSEKYHYECGVHAAKSKVDILLVTGVYAKDYKSGFDSLNYGEFISFEDKSDLTNYIINNLNNEVAVLFKASNGAKLNTVFNEVKEGIA